MNKKSKNNKRKKIIISIIVLVIILLIMLILKFISLKNKEVTPEKTGVATPIYIKDDESKLYPENIFAIVYRYKGKADLITVYNSLYKFKKYVEILSENDTLKTEEDIQEYYDINANNIKEYTGIKDKDSFKKLFNECQKLSKSKKEFEKATIDMNSIIEEDDRITCTLDIKYKDATVSFKFTALYSGTNSRNTYLYEAL